MSSQDVTRPIVVAIDGSKSALGAARWAAAEAVRRGRPLRVVHAYQWPLPEYGPVSFSSTMTEAVTAGAAKVVRDALAEAERAEPGLRPEGAAVRGAPVPVLLDESAKAELLVLGSRGLGGFAELLVGSVAIELTAHGRCPVVVVRGETAVGNAPVVVGVDGSPASTVALELAFAEAAYRDRELVAVLAWTDAVFPIGPYGGSYPAIDWTDLVRQARELLAERLAGWQEKYPQVTVRRVIENDRPAQALLDAATGAELLVVGSRGRGGFAGLLLGSVSQAMIHHSPCPVLIARAGSTG
jgi:nucleotide-binding universal stress UspA family protein